MQGYSPFRDAVFWTGVALYALNRVLLRDLFPDSFFTRHLNDFLLVPIFSPLMVGALALCRLRTSQGSPRGSEVLLPILVTGFVFEVLHPLSPYFREFSTGDPLDILWYVLGGIAATLVWQGQGDHPLPTSDERLDAPRAQPQRCRDTSP